MFINRLLLGFICLNLCASVSLGRDREAARRAFQQANNYYELLMDRPLEERGLDQYQRSIYLFRLVVDHDPTYGGSDDAVYRIASLFDEMAGLFDRPSDRSRALYYYRFLAREYPLTRFRAAALRRVEELESNRNIARSSSSEIRRQDPPSREPSPPSDPSPAGDRALLSEVRYWSNEDYTRVVLQLDREVEFEKSMLQDPDRIYFDLDSTTVDPQLVDSSYDVNGLFIRQIRVAENRPGVVRVVLDFDQIRGHTVFALYDPFRIVIDTRGESRRKESPPSAPARVAEEELDSIEETPQEASADLGSRPVVGPEPADAESTGEAIQGNWTLTRTLGLKVGRVVIDPGHGGKDPGTVGPSGLREKNVVLSVALRLRDLLVEQTGLEVILTRDDDRFVPLEERTAIANQKRADLFISIHANASRNPRATGIETYVLDFATSPDEIEVASRENASAQRNIHDLENLLKQIALDDYNQESRDLAETVQHRLVDEISKHHTPQLDRGVKQAPFIVLIGSQMPSILAEIGFLSNPSDEKFFKETASHDKVAQALFLGIAAYFRSSGTVPEIDAATSATGR